MKKDMRKKILTIHTQNRSRNIIRCCDIDDYSIDNQLIIFIGRLLNLFLLYLAEHKIQRFSCLFLCHKKLKSGKNFVGFYGFVFETLTHNFGSDVFLNVGCCFLLLLWLSYLLII